MLLLRSESGARQLGSRTVAKIGTLTPEVIICCGDEFSRPGNAEILVGLVEVGEDDVEFEADTFGDSGGETAAWLCGMFSGYGCCDPTDTDVSSLPALLRA